MRRDICRGFTLTELLIVIAIVTVIASFLFPVLHSLRDRRRQLTCVTNMHALAQAAAISKIDNGAYPPRLLGIAERRDGWPWLDGDLNSLVPADQMRHGFLFPAYVPHIETFHCPKNRAQEKDAITSARYAPNSPRDTKANYAVEGKGGATVESDHGVVDRRLMQQDPERYRAIIRSRAAMQFYLFDSYDITPSVGPDGNFVASNGEQVFSIVYERDWTGNAGATDVPQQLKYPDAPLDRTILGWCSLHSEGRGSNRCNVMFASGSVKSIEVRRLFLYSFLAAEQNP